MKVHRVEILIVDYDDMGAEGVCAALENARYPNRCIYPEVMQIETREVEWNDGHPLNHRDKQAEAYKALFGRDLPPR